MAEKTIGARLREALTEIGMSMAALSEAADVPYSSVQNYAADKQLPGAEALIKIKRASGISIDWLLAGEGETFSKPQSRQPRPLQMSDYQELRERFTNFDDVFQVRKSVGHDGKTHFDADYIESLPEPYVAMLCRQGLTAALKSDDELYRQVHKDIIGDRDPDTMTDAEVVLASNTAMVEYVKALGDKHPGSEAAT